MGYTTQEMIDFWKKSKDTKESNYLYRKDYIADQLNGLYLYKRNTVVCLKRGLRHNDSGPAFIIVNHLEEEAITEIYYIEGESLLGSDIVTRMIKARGAQHKGT